MDWEWWEATVRQNGITLDRPQGSLHPRYPDIRYPIDYGYVNGTLGEDGEEVDIFVGSRPTGLVAAIHTRDHRKGDAEMKLIYNCSPQEIYMVNGFLNFDKTLMEGRLVMRWPMADVWEAIERTP